jgi:Leucine Rich repeat
MRSASDLINNIAKDTLLELRSVDLINDFNDEQLEQLSSVLKISKSIQRIELRDSDINPITSRLLGEDLVFNDSVKAVELDNLQNLRSYVPELQKLIQFNTSIERLEMRNILDGDAIICALQNQLENNIKIRELHLFNCSLSKNGCSSLGQILKKNDSLEVLSICHQFPINEFLPEILEAIRKPSKIKSLTLKSIGIDDITLKSLSNMISANENILRLNLDHNELKKSSLAYLIKIFQNKYYLTHISLCNTNMDHIFATEFAKSFHKNTQIESIDLSHNNLGDIGATMVARYAAALLSLSQLNLSNNHISQFGEYFINESLSKAGGKINLTLA